jgi:8-oxo-dGTP pyrophosphatase MutT (NUDIX family)
MSQENPWKTSGTRLIYENPWIRLREDSVIRPDGKPGIYSVVETRVATGVVALTPEREIYLVGQYRYPTEHYSWEIVEGGAEPNEDPLEAARRELREEAGLIADDWSPIGGEVHLSNCFSSERAVFFLARGLTEVGSSPEGTEVLQLRKVRLSEALGMISRSEIKDAMSIIALYRISGMLADGSLK